MREHRSQFLKDGQGVHTTFTPVLQEPRFPGGPSSLLSSPPSLCPIRLASLPAASNLNHPSVYYISFLSFTSITGAAADVPTPCFAESLSDSITFYVPIGWHAPALSPLGSQPKSPCSSELRHGLRAGRAADTPLLGRLGLVGRSRGESDVQEGGPCIVLWGLKSGKDHGFSDRSFRNGLGRPAG